jgi:hypothetical protein
MYQTCQNQYYKTGLPWLFLASAYTIPYSWMDRFIPIPYNFNGEINEFNA